MSTKTEDVVKTRFERDTAEHEMTIIHDDGLFRVVQFAKPGTFQYAYTLTTWHGYLCISGDMGTTVFSRLPDMFEFFTAHTINPDYWHQKVVAGHETQQYNSALALDYIDEQVKSWCEELEPEEAAALRSYVENYFIGALDTEEELHQALNAFEHPNGHRFYDTWEWDLRDYAYRFLWQLHAIRTGVEKYWAVR
jgi:hypothetical protein